MKTADFFWNLTDPETIAQNQQGRLSQRQQEILYRHTPWPITAVAIYLFMLALLAIPFFPLVKEDVPTLILLMYIVIFGGMALLILGFSIYYAWRGVTDRQDVRQGKVIGGHGEVVRTRNGYAARVQGAKLRALLRKVDLLPGRYYFYYLPRSRFLLSAEAQEVGGESGSVELQQHLGKRFRFNEGDLVSNRSGQLSAGQRIKLLFQSAVYGVFLLIAVALLPLIASKAFQSEEFVLFSYQTACLALLILSGIGWLAWLSGPRLVEAVVGQNLTAVGPVHLQYEGSGRSHQLYYVVNDVKLPVGYKDYYTIVEGLTYRVYYTRWSKKIMSMETV